MAAARPAGCGAYVIGRKRRGLRRERRHARQTGARRAARGAAQRTERATRSAAAFDRAPSMRSVSGPRCHSSVSPARRRRSNQLRPRASTKREPCGLPVIHRPRSPSTVTRSTRRPGPSSLPAKPVRARAAELRHEQPAAREPRAAGRRARAVDERQRAARRGAADVDLVGVAELGQPRLHDGEAHVARRAPGATRVPSCRRPGGASAGSARGLRSIVTAPMPSTSRSASRADGTAASAPAGSASTSDERDDEPARAQRTARRMLGQPSRHRARDVGRRRVLEPHGRARAASRRAVGRVMGLPDLAAQLRERARQARLHGAAAAAERGRGLGLRQLEQVAAGDDLALRLGELVDRRQHGRAALGRDDGGLGGRGRVPRGPVVAGPPGEPGTTARRAALVVRLVADDAQQPRPKRRAGAEAPQRPVGLDERLLRGVLGVVVAGGDEAGCAEGDLLMGADELGVGGHVPALGALDEVVLGWSAHHRSHYTGGADRVPAQADGTRAARRV